MLLSESSRFLFTPDLTICRLLNGMWQVSGAHGRIDPQGAIASMVEYFDAGYTTWDLADHYGPAEDFIGAFRRQLVATRGEAALSQVQAFTKWVPRPGPMPRSLVESSIDRSRQRMDTPCLDLLQFHWWDYRFLFTPDLTICRLLNGMWQVSGAHGRIDPQGAIASMVEYFDAGYTTWDLADHYGPAEDFIGAFRRQLVATRGEAALSQVQAFTKWVPRPGPMPRSLVESSIDRSRQRMDTPCLDLLQFHWWDYGDPAYLDALKHMVDLQREGKIRHLALTNFDTEHLQIILDSGIPIVSNQVQYSLVDRRPEVYMAKLCQARGVHLLTYGTLCGGFLSDRYLGKPEPRRGELATVSQQKYKRMIDAWGGWGLFQDLLKTLSLIHISEPTRH